MAPIPASRKIHQDISVRYGYFSSHWCKKYHATGIAMAHEMITRLTKSFDNICHRLNILAPSTFRTPISLVRCSATNEASPNNPRQEMKTARMAKKVERLPIRFSSSNFRAYSSSVNLYSKGAAGLYFLNTASTFASPVFMVADGFKCTMITLAHPVFSKNIVGLTGS